MYIYTDRCIYNIYPIYILGRSRENVSYAYMATQPVSNALPSLTKPSLTPHPPFPPQAMNLTLA